MFLRHGKVIAEGWWNPYAPDLKHTMYSVSKSFTSTAIGFAVTEKLLTVNDKVISFFPDDLPDTVSDYLSTLTIKDLLSMTDGQDPDPTGTVIEKDSNWVKAYLALPFVVKPGTTFLYNSLGVYMLSAIIQKVTGEKMIDYLEPRLFEPLGITGVDWETDPHGINSGGWGLRLKTEDMAKFGQLYLQKGKWQGKQIIPESWVDEATSIQIMQRPGSYNANKDSTDWEQGYGYLFWRCRHNAFRADGAFCQFIIVIPEKDAVVAITSESNGYQDEMNLVWKYLLPAIKDNQLPADDESDAILKQKLSSLALAPPESNVAPQDITEISGKTFMMAPNEMGIKSMSLQFKDDLCSLVLTTNKGEYNIDFEKNKWKTGKTAMLGPSLVGKAKGFFVPPSAIAGSFNWTDNNTLELTLRYIESPHTETITCTFAENKINCKIKNSVDGEKNAVALAGTINGK